VSALDSVPSARAAVGKRRDSQRSLVYRFERECLAQPAGLVRANVPFFGFLPEQRPFAEIASLVVNVWLAERERYA
jgi:hypothetical protein